MADKERYLRESKAYQETKAKAMAELAAKQAAEEAEFDDEEVDDIEGNQYVDVDSYDGKGHADHAGGACLGGRV